jgi:hypothetical protein
MKWILFYLRQFRKLPVGYWIRFVRESQELRRTFPEDLRKAREGWNK